MRNSRKVARRVLALVVPSAMVLGTTCMSDVRNAAVSAGLDFAEDTVSLILETFIPIEDIITGGAQE